MSAFIDSIRAEFQRYHVLAERALDQVPDELLNSPGFAGGNSLAVIVWHVSGNLASRFTDFLTADGEKPWRNRDEEFVSREVSREALSDKWDAGWKVLFDAIDPLTDGDLHRMVAIRGQALTVHDALHRSLAHVAYHVGQIVYMAHAHRGDGWKYLSIPPGQSAAYNAAPKSETPAAHMAFLAAQQGDKPRS